MLRDLGCNLGSAGVLFGPYTELVGDAPNLLAHKHPMTPHDGNARCREHNVVWLGPLMEPKGGLHSSKDNLGQPLVPEFLD